jgi:Flp pilus assembly protein TadB
MGINVSLVMNVLAVVLAGACVHLIKVFPIVSLVMAFVCGMLVVVSCRYSIRLESGETKEGEQLQDS